LRFGRGVRFGHHGSWYIPASASAVAALAVGAREAAERAVPLDDRTGSRTMTPAFRFSRGGTIAAGSFLLSAAAVFAWVFVAASGNPADSGESGILLLPFAMPWITLVPSAWLGPSAGLGCILLNSFVLYCVFGGLRIARRTAPPS
jgi:hypothetical protein